MKFRRQAILFFALSLAVGCGKSNGRQAISGTVNFKGGPLENGRVAFMTTGDKPVQAAGALITNGKFKIPAEMGLEPGVYRVVLSAPGPIRPRTPEEVEAGASAAASELMPPEYGKDSKVTIEVKAGVPNDFTWNVD